MTLDWTLSHRPNQLRVLCLQLHSLRTGGDYGPLLPVGLNICCVTVPPEADVRPAVQQSFSHDSDDVGRGRRLQLPRDDARHRPRMDLRAEKRPTAERRGIAATPPPGPFFN